MISEYFRPATVDEAVTLLTDRRVIRKPLAGGTSLSRQQTGVQGVVDLQAAGLDQIVTRAQRITAGAMSRLSVLLHHPDIHPEIKRAIRIDTGQNLRNMATLGGTLVSADGRSILSAVMLALDATLTWEPDGNKISLGNWLPLREQESPGVLITEVAWSFQPTLTFEYAARSPKDQPILIVAATQWGSGRTRIVLGGFGKTPVVAMDGLEEGGADVAARNAYFEAEDQWASASYRREVAAKLALRCLQKIDVLKERED